MMGAGRYLLALETSGKSGSVAMATLRGDHLLTIAQENLDPEWGSARTLAPAIDRLLDRLGLSVRMLNAISVVQGPGSFTGLRVGAATAKTMAWALGIPLIAVDALDCVAAQAERAMGAGGSERPQALWVVSDAYRGQVFRAEYVWRVDRLECRLPTGIEDIESVVARSRVLPLSTTLAGPGVGKVLRWLEDHGSMSAHPWGQVVRGPESMPMAETVAILGWNRWMRGETEDVLGFLPRYYRRSAAEEKQKGTG
jgi:tRNA threonylcarbamoyladenosine biosynthesis protein TsaB